MLSVSGFKPKHQRSTESAVEKAWAATWRELGIYSRHMSDAVPGLPDRYISGGRWVEFKSLYRVKGAFSYGEGLSPEQIRTCADLSRAGDRVWYCAQLDGWQWGKCYIFQDWLAIEKRIGDPLNCEMFPKDEVVWEATADNRRRISQSVLSLAMRL